MSGKPIRRSSYGSCRLAAGVPTKNSGPDTLFDFRRQFVKNKLVGRFDKILQFARRYSVEFGDADPFVSPDIRRRVDALSFDQLFKFLGRAFKRQTPSDRVGTGHAKHFVADA